jgi:preprotein translocase subunit SecG
MIILITIIHVLVCTFLILVVLLQSGKAADIAGAFGGMGSQTTFGPRGAATALSRATTWAAGLFMVTSLTLSVLQTREAARSGAPGAGSTVLERVPSKAAVPPASAPSTQPVTLPGGQPLGQPIQIPINVQGQVGNTPAPASQTPAAPKK